MTLRESLGSSVKLGFESDVFEDDCKADATGMSTKIVINTTNKEEGKNIVIYGIKQGKHERLENLDASLAAAAAQMRTE